MAIFTDTQIKEFIDFWLIQPGGDTIIRDAVRDNPDISSADISRATGFTENEVTNFLNGDKALPSQTSSATASGSIIDPLVNEFQVSTSTPASTFKPNRQNLDVEAFDRFLASKNIFRNQDPEGTSPSFQDKFVFDPSGANKPIDAAQLESLQREFFESTRFSHPEIFGSEGLFGFIKQPEGFEPFGETSAIINGQTFVRVPKDLSEQFGGFFDPKFGYVAPEDALKRAGLVNGGTSFGEFLSRASLFTLPFTGNIFSFLGDIVPESITNAFSTLSENLKNTLASIFPEAAQQGPEALVQAADQGGFTILRGDELTRAIEAGTSGSEGAFIESAGLNNGSILFGPDGIPIGADIGEAFVPFDAAKPFFQVSPNGEIVSSADGISFQPIAGLPNINTGINITGAPTGATTGLTTGTTTGAVTGATTGITTGAATGITTGATTGLLSGVGGAVTAGLTGAGVGAALAAKNTSQLSPEERALLTEQTEILRLQRSLFTKQIADAMAIQPELFRSLGYERDANGKLIKLPASPEEQARGEIALKSLGVSKAELDNLIATQPQEFETAQRLRDRELAALRGELPIDPTLKRALDEERARLEGTLRSNLGPGFETSTPGIQALTDFAKKRAEAEFTANQKEIILGEQFGAARRAASLGNVDLGLRTTELAESLRKSRLGDIFSVQQLPFGPAANLSATASGFSGPLSTLANSRLLQAQQSSQFASGLGNLVGAALFSPIFGAGKPSLFGNLFS